MGSLAISLCHLAAGRIDAVCSLKPARSVDIAAGAAARARARPRDRALRRRRAFGEAPLDLERVHASPQREPTSCAAARRRALTRIGRLLRLELRPLEHGVFYPSGCPPGAGSSTTRERFDTVEVNNTFYRLPKRAAVARWVEQTPPGFVFAVKVAGT